MAKEVFFPMLMLPISVGLYKGIHESVIWLGIALLNIKSY